jgi:hypothetical protein
MMETKSDKTGKVCSLPCSSCHIGQWRQQVASLITLMNKDFASWVK